MDEETDKILTMAKDPKQSARERIQAAYDPQLLQNTGQRLVKLLTEHLQGTQASSGSVLNWTDPENKKGMAQASMDRYAPYQTWSTEGGDGLARQFEELVRLALGHGLNLHDPRYIGHQVPASIPLAGLFDALGSVTNQVMAIYEMGPWATAVEHALVAQLGQMIGWQPGGFSGLITHGGSLANLTALLTARNVSLNTSWEAGVPGKGPSPVVVVHADAHYSVTRAAGVLGLGTRNVIPAPLDDRRRMDPEKLDELLASLRKKGHPIVATVAAACATPIGAFDPLQAIADVCQRHEVWLHVDAAHGGSACFSRRYRHLLAGIEHCDSMIWDAHKMLFVPALCAFVFYRNAEQRFEAFQQSAPYLFDPSAPGISDYDSALKTVECTKRAAAFGLWGTWSLFGPQLFEDMVDTTFDMGRIFYEKLEATSDFEPLHEAQCNIVAFRYLPNALRHAQPETIGQFQRDLRRRVIKSGEFYLVQTTLDGMAALRVTIINPLTTPEHLDALLDALRQHGKMLISDG